MTRRLFLLACVAVVGVFVWSWGQLPDRVATHFGTSGSPDGWSSRTGAVLGLGAIALVLAVVLGGLAFWVTRGMPLTLVNMPGKQRWVEAGQEARFRTMMAEDLWFMDLVTMVLMGVVQVLVVRANRQQPPALDGWAVAAIVVYLAVLVAQTVWMVTIRYRRPPGDLGNSST